MSEAAEALKFLGSFGTLFPTGGADDDVGVAEASLIELLRPIELIA